MKQLSMAVSVLVRMRKADLEVGVRVQHYPMLFSFVDFFSC